MTKQYKKTYVKRTLSKDSLRNFSLTKQNATVFPNFNMETVLQMIDSDPVARGAINHFVDKCMEGDYSIIKRDYTYDPAFEMLLSAKYNFRTDVLRKIFLMGKIFNNVFIEIVKTSGNETKELNVLDTQNIEPVTAPNGDALEYYSRIPNPITGERAHWSKDEIVWIKFGDRSVGYAPIDLKAIYENLLAKEYVTRYVAWLWKTGQYRVLYNPKGGSDKEIEDFLAYLRRNDDSYQVPFILKGEMETKVVRDVKETESISTLLKYYDSNTLILLRISPIDAGIPDASGRSNADAQSNSLSTHITGWKKIVEDKISFDLFPKINKSNNLLKFGQNDRFAASQVFKNIQIMSSMNMTDEAIQEYMADQGMFFESTLFKKPEELNPMDTEGADNPRDKDMAPSRKGKDPQAAPEKIGTGEQSSTKSSQLRKE
jgi:hypothetical protein